jgi:hypothetical protein
VTNAERESSGRMGRLWTYLTRGLNEHRIADVVSGTRWDLRITSGYRNPANLFIAWSAPLRTVGTVATIDVRAIRTRSSSNRYYPKSPKKRGGSALTY